MVAWRRDMALLAPRAANTAPRRHRLHDLGAWRDSVKQTSATPAFYR